MSLVPHIDDKQSLRVILHSYLSGRIKYTDIRKWNVSRVSDMSDVFSYIISTEQINDSINGIQDWDVSRVTNMENMFEGSIDFNQPLNWDIKNVKNTKNMFANCQWFRVPFELKNASKLVEVENMFWGCFKIDKQSVFKFVSSLSPELTERFPDIYSHLGLPALTPRPSLAPTPNPPTPPPPQPIPSLAPSTPPRPSLAPTPTPEIPFRERFPDFDDFKEFIDSRICGSSLSEDEFASVISGIRKSNGMKASNAFCYNFKGKIIEETFTVNSPPGYSFNDIPMSVTDEKEDPFHEALKYLYSEIPHYKPSVEMIPGKMSEHLYMVLLDRLIYYYNIYILLAENKLRGFENTAGIVIFSHGHYPSYQTDVIVDVPESVDNLFCLTRSAPGCYIQGLSNGLSKEAKNKKSAIWEMTDQIVTDKFVTYDIIAYNVMSNLSFGSCYDCYVVDKKRGRSMETNISPNTKQFINKTYQLIFDEHKVCYVIDLERFYQYRDIIEDPDELLSVCSIVDTEYIRGVSQIRDNKVMITLKNIVDYCADVLGKQNIFIDDRSCGTVSISGQPEIGYMVARSKEFASKGHGRIRKTKSRKTKRRHHSNRIKRKTKKTKKQ